MSKKLSALTKVSTLGDDTLIYAVDPARTIGDRSVGIDKDDLAAELGVGGSNYIYDVKDVTYGAKGDGIDLEDGAITASDASFSSASATFVTGDVGKVIAIEGAGTAGAYHVTTIATFTDANNVELTDNAVTTVSGANFFYGTDDTVAIQATIQAAFDANGGVVFFPVGIYVLDGALQNTSGVNENSQLTIPEIDGDAVKKPTISFEGESSPSFRQSGGIGTGFTESGNVVLRSTITGSGTTPCVITNRGHSGNILQMSFTHATFKNLMIQTLPDANDALTMGGINCFHTKNASFENIVVFPYLINLADSAEPASTVNGIMFPKINCEHQNIALNCLVGGLTNGYYLGEHSTVMNCSANVCTNGIMFSSNSHVNTLIKFTSHWCKHDINFDDSSFSYFRAVTMQTEWDSDSKWYDNTFTIKDTSNVGNGTAYINVVEAGVGVNSEKFLKDGGDNIKVYSIGQATSNTITTSSTMKKDWFNIPNIYDVATDSTLTIPAFSTTTSYRPNISDVATFITKDAGNLQFVAGSGAVNIHTKTTDFLQTNGQYSKAVLECIGENEYILTGDTQLYSGTGDYTSDLISYWKFNGDGLDAVGANDATMTNVTYSAGKSGNAAELNGTTTDIEVSDDNTLSFGDGATDSAVSWSGFFYFDVAGSGDGLFGKRETGGQFEYQCRFQSNTLEFTMFDNLAATNYIRASHAWTPSTSTWYHVVITYSGNGAHSGVTFYIDGVDLGTLTNGSVNEGSYVAMDNGTASLNIGNMVDGSGNEMDGRVDGFGIWNKELNATEAGDIYTQQDGGSELVP